MPAFRFSRHVSAIAASSVAIGCLSISGCALLFSPRQITVEKAVIDETPRDVPQRATREDTILVFAPKTAPLYDTTQMAYSTQPHQMAYFSEREWGETPSQMLFPLIVKTLGDSHAFHAVLTEPCSGRCRYALRTEVLQLIQEFTPDSAVLVLALRFQLTDSETRIASTEEVSVREPMSARNSAAGVLAANEATGRALQQMVQYVLQSAQP
jgi:cholesterol transport system auxiliary component